MRFFNEYEVSDAVVLYEDHETLGPATQTLQNLVDWTNANSDGWPYWSKPARAASQLVELLHGDGTWSARESIDDRATVDAVRKALRPIRAFRTRHGGTFEVLAP